MRRRAARASMQMEHEAGTPASCCKKLWRDCYSRLALFVNEDRVLILRRKASTIGLA